MKISEKSVNLIRISLEDSSIVGSTAVNKNIAGNYLQTFVVGNWWFSEIRLMASSSCSFFINNEF